MTHKHTSLILALAAFASASAFAEGNAISSSSGTTVSSGTGITVSQGAPSSTVMTTPSTSFATEGTYLMPGGTKVQSSQTTVLGGPAAGGVSGTQTIVTRYWVNVPAGVDNRADFQRWTHLK